MEQTFNSGMPPGGERGMCRKQGGSWQFWNESFYGFLMECPQHAIDYHDQVGVFSNDSGHWRWAAIRELTEAGIPEAEARTMVHRSQLPEAQEPALWYPPQQEGFGPWIEYDGSGSRPVAEDELTEIMMSSERAGLNFKPEAYQAAEWAWGSGIVAYCVKLDAAAVGAQSSDPGWHDWHEGDTVPSVDRVDVIRITAGIKGTSEHQIDNVVTTSQYWGPNSFVRKWRPAVVAPVTADPNAKMVSRDGSMSYGRLKWSDMGASYCVMLTDAPAVAKECHGALTCAPWTNRLGGWNAS